MRHHELLMRRARVGDHSADRLITYMRYISNPNLKHLRIRLRSRNRGMREFVKPDTEERRLGENESSRTATLNNVGLIIG